MYICMYECMFVCMSMSVCVCVCVKRRFNFVIIQVILQLLDALIINWLHCQLTSHKFYCFVFVRFHSPLPGEESANHGFAQETSISEELLINMERLKRSSSPELPDTVTKIETPEGCKVYLVGTAHFSKESQEDVEKVLSNVF